MPDLPSLSDGEVIEAVLAGEREQFTVLVTRYQLPLLRVANSRLARTDWAEDAVQETFLCAYKWLHTYNSKYSFRTWLWTILLNQCQRQWKKQTRSGRATTVSYRHDDSLAAAAALQAGDHVCPRNAAEARERTLQLDQVLKELAPEQADALRLRFFGELKFHEIATAMNCSLSTAKNRVRWGLERVSGILATNGMDLGGELTRPQTIQSQETNR